MQSRFSTRAISRFVSRQSGRSAPTEAMSVRVFLVLATVDTDSVTALRHDVMTACGDRLESMRIEACDHGRRMKVRLHIAGAGADGVIDDVLRRLSP